MRHKQPNRPDMAPSRVLAPLEGPSFTAVPRTRSLRTPEPPDWTIMYGDIERLYVRERRKLRYIISFVETKYGLRVTEQMFKKRFCKWGFQKNSGRSSRISSPSEHQEQRSCTSTSRRSPYGAHRSVTTLFGHVPSERHDIAILTNVRDWATAFFETALTPVHPSHRQVEKNVLDLERSTEVGRAFKLVARLMAKGYGTLAGETARKAFLLLEEMFSLDGPALTWNLLAIMYDLAVTQQTKLLEMLVSHVLSLAERKFHGNHPLLTLLTNLQRHALHRSSRFIAGNGTSRSSKSSSESTTSRSSTDDGPAVTTELTYEDALPFSLERAWVFNAELLFEHLDIRLMHIYCRLDLESSALVLPLHTLELAHQWIDCLEKANSCNALEAEESATSNTSLPIGEQHVVSIAENCSVVSSLSLEEYECIRSNGIAKVRRQLRDAFCRQGREAGSDIVVQIRVLGGLMTELVPGSLGPVLVSSETGSIALSSAHAGHLSYMSRASRDLNRLRTDGSPCSATDDIHSLQSILHLCEYAYGKNSLRVVQEMFSLQDAYVAAGDTKEAEKVERDVISRIKQYTYEPLAE